MTEVVNVKVEVVMQELSLKWIAFQYASPILALSLSRNTTLSERGSRDNPL